MTNDDELAEKFKMIANHGQSKKYYHDRVGCNSRLDNLQAAVLRVKLKELNNYIKSRISAADYYDDRLQDVSFLETPFRDSKSNHVFHQYTLKLSEKINRDKLIQFLASKNIPAMVYYPVPAHQQKMFTNIPATVKSMKKTEWLSQRVISLPMHTELSNTQQDFIIENITNFLKNKNEYSCYWNWICGISNWYLLSRDW